MLLAVHNIDAIKGERMLEKENKPLCCKKTVKKSMTTIDDKCS